MFFYNTDKRYNRFSDHLRNLYGVKVYKVTLDAGFTCPNRDGTISDEGCIFCDNGGSFSQLYPSSISVKEQLDLGILLSVDKYKAKKFLAYFQAYSNTYKPVKELEKIYNEALSHEDVIGMSIGTRPDCIDNEKLDLIANYAKDRYVWIEYGLQSIHERSLKFINRGHSFETFCHALKETQKRDINVCAHVILGLPVETKKDMLETAKVLGDLGVNGVKIHLLCVLNNTRLAKLYFQGKIPIMEEDEYVETVCDFLELLPPEVTIHRLAGNGLKPNMLAPAWLSKKFVVLNKIDKLLEKRNSFQGAAVNRHMK
ncbi:MAG: TIGR01212 family radical SAM protein [Candidatus Gastranaerophilales bacterium]|nr:TIGR01212 family radical SAM protein [Candidatus Gastranaerophilales bacterium]